MEVCVHGIQLVTLLSSGRTMRGASVPCVAPYSLLLRSNVYVSVNCICIVLCLFNLYNCCAINLASLLLFSTKYDTI